MAENNSQAPAAQGKLNPTSNSQVNVPFEPTQFYFRPDTAEIIFVPMADAAKFQAHGYEMTNLVLDMQKANVSVTDAMAAYQQAMKSPDPQVRIQAQAAYDKATADQKKSSESVKEVIKKLEPLAKVSTGGNSIVELIPLSQNPGTGKSRQINRKIVHVQSNNIRTQNGWRAFPLDNEQRASSRARNVPGSQASNPNGAKNIIKTINGKRKIDTAELKKQLKDFKPQVKAAWKATLAEGILFDWAENMNKDLVYKEAGMAGHFTNNVDVTLQAQMMRYLAGTGAETSWDPKAGKAGIKAEAKAEFSLAEAKASIKLYAPHRLGWVLQFTSPTSGKPYPLGAVRGKLELVAAGACGASLMVELSSEVQWDNLKLKIKGNPNPGPPPTPNPNGGPIISGSEVKVSPAKVDAGAFAGVKADVDLAGSLQWLNPESASKEFEDFIKIAPGLSAMAGAGAGVKFEISYRSGKFIIVMQASLCLGLGARGKLAFETDAVKIMTFVAWFFYQLYHANFEFLTFVTRRAFDAIKDIQFLVIQTGKNAAEFLYDSAERIGAKVQDVLSAMEKSGARNALASRILSDTSMLRISTPETKGMLLYQLTRHGKTDWVDPGNYQGFLDPYHNRKLAILRVLEHVQTINEWRNVFQHMDPEGRKTNGSHQLTVERFLNQGRDMLEDMKSIERRLRSQPARGYPVMANNTAQYAMFDSDHPQFAFASEAPLSQLDVSYYA